MKQIRDVKLASYTVFQRQSDLFINATLFFDEYKRRYPSRKKYKGKDPVTFICSPTGKHFGTVILHPEPFKEETIEHKGTKANLIWLHPTYFFAYAQTVSLEIMHLACERLVELNNLADPEKLKSYFKPLFETKPPPKNTTPSRKRVEAIFEHVEAIKTDNVTKVEARQTLIIYDPDNDLHKIVEATDPETFLRRLRYRHKNAIIQLISKTRLKRELFEIYENKETTNGGLFGWHKLNPDDLIEIFTKYNFYKCPVKDD